MGETFDRPPDRQRAALRKNYTVVLLLLGITGLVLLLLLITIGVWWSNLRRSDELTRRAHPAKGSDTPLAAAPLPVAVVTARAARAAAVISLPARPARSTDPVAPAPRRVLAPVTGRVTEVLAVPGAGVRAGQIVARITSPVRVARRPQVPRRRLSASPRSRSGERDRAIRQAQQRLAAAQKAVEAAERRLADLPKAQARALATREAARQELPEAEALLARSRAELSEREASLRQSERLYQAGAASRAEMEDDAAARAAAARRLEQAEERARTTRSAAAAASEAASRGGAVLNTSREQLARARNEVEAARRSVRAVEDLPQASNVRVPHPSSGPSSAVLSHVQRLAEVRTPSSGTVTRVLASVGAAVTRGEPLLHMEHMVPSARGAGERHRRFRAEGPSAQLRGVRKGISARFRLADGTRLPAHVSDISSPDDRRLVLELVTAGPGLPPARTKALQIELTVPAAETVVIVPDRAVQRTPSEATLWIAKPVKAEDRERREPEAEGGTAWTAYRQRVQIGAVRQGKAEVRSGLEPGSRVIVAGMEQLREGQRVSVVPWSLP